MAFSVKDTQLTVRNEVNLEGGTSVFSSVSQENYRWMVLFSKPRITSNSGLDFFLIHLRGKKTERESPTSVTCSDSYRELDKMAIISFSTC